MFEGFKPISKCRLISIYHWGFQTFASKRPDSFSFSLTFHFYKYQKNKGFNTTSMSSTYWVELNLWISYVNHILRQRDIWTRKHGLYTRCFGPHLALAQTMDNQLGPYTELNSNYGRFSPHFALARYMDTPTSCHSNRRLRKLHLRSFALCYR